MKKKEMRRYSKTDLLKMLAEQMEQNEQLKQKLCESEIALKDRKIEIQDAGSIAEAALQISHVFDAAQQAASLYLENAARVSKEKEVLCEQMLKEASKKAEQIERDAKEEARLLISLTTAECEEKRRKADKYWEKVAKRVDDLCNVVKEVDLSLQWGHKNDKEEPNSPTNNAGSGAGESGASATDEQGKDI